MRSDPRASRLRTTATTLLLMLAATMRISAIGAATPAAPASVQAPAEDLLDVGLLFDAGDSNRSRFLASQSASEVFLRQVVASTGAWAFVTSFDKEAALEQGFTQAPARLERAVGRIPPGGGCAVWDAVYATASDMMGPAAKDRSARRALVLLVQRKDDRSRILPAAALKAAQDAGATVFVITELPEDADLARLAKATGGRAFFRTHPAGMTAAFASVLAALRGLGQ